MEQLKVWLVFQDRILEDQQIDVKVERNER